jgi:hypothetical protein
MAKAKFDFQKFFLEKGEKVAIAVGAALMVLMFVLAGMAVATSASTDEKQKGLTGKAKSIDQTIQTGGGSPSALDPTLLGRAEYPTLASRSTTYFIDLPLDSAKRGQPQILPPTEFQVDIVRAPILVYRLTGEGDKRSILVKQQVKASDKTKFNAKILRERNKPDKSSANRPAAPAGPGMPGGPGRPGGGMGGGMYGPGGGGMGGPGMPGGMGGPGMGGPGMAGGGGVPGGAGAGGGTETVFESVSLDKFEAGKYQPVQFIRPIRMILVQASFPFKRQLDEYQKALRYHSLQELLAHKEDHPDFKGFKIQRQIRTLDGSRIVEEWRDYDWLASYKPIFVEKVLEDAPEDEQLKQFGIVPEVKTRLCVPLPLLARGSYPKVEMRSILDAKERLEKAGKSEIYKPAGSEKFKGEVNPFGESEAPASKDEKGPDASQSLEVPDAILVRFVDVGVEAGYAYEYRIQMVMANPNLGKDKEVGRPDFAKEKELVGQPVEVTIRRDNEAVTQFPVGSEAIVYSFAPEAKGYVRPEHARVQVQAWFDRIATDKTNRNATEDFGEWVVESIDVARGQYVAGTANVKLPRWEAKDDQYELRDLARVKTGGAAPALKGVVPVEFATRTLVVDFEGGSGQRAVRTKTVREEAGLEMLLIGPDGKLRVRNSISDKNERERVDREKAWTKWLEDVKNNVEKTKGNTGDPFKKGGGEPGKGGT